MARFSGLLHVPIFGRKRGRYWGIESFIAMCHNNLTHCLTSLNPLAKEGASFNRPTLSRRGLCVSVLKITDLVGKVWFEHRQQGIKSAILGTQSHRAILSLSRVQSGHQSPVICSTVNGHTSGNVDKGSPVSFAARRRAFG